MTRRALKHYRGGGFDPFQHNRLVARRKKWARLALQLRDAGRSTDKAAASFRALAVSAQAAADSLRKIRRTL